MPESRKVRYIVHTDCRNEADDQFTLAHCLLTPMLDIKGIIAGHFDSCCGRFPAGTTARESYEEIQRVMDAMDMTGMYPVKCGSGIPMPDEETPVDSEGAQHIIREGMKEDSRPLYTGMQGAMTDLASAILMEPRICGRMTAIWIGGGPYPEGGEEFNLYHDVAAANVVMRSSMPLWQVPSNVYKCFAVSRVKPFGKLGACLFDQLTELNLELCGRAPDFNWPHGELWGLGDEGVIAALMHEGQRTDLYRMVPAPAIDHQTFAYDLHTDNRRIRVYDRMDYRLTLEDLFCKIEILAQE